MLNLSTFRHIFKSRPVLDKPKKYLTEAEYDDYQLEYLDFVDGRRLLWSLCLFVASAVLLLGLIYNLADMLMPDRAFVATGLAALFLPLLWFRCLSYVDHKCEDFYFGRANERAE